MKINETYKKLLSKDYEKLWQLIIKANLEIIAIVNKGNDSKKKKTVAIIKYHGRLNDYGKLKAYVIVIGSTGIEYGHHLYDDFNAFEKDCTNLELEFFDIDKIEGK